MVLLARKYPQLFARHAAGLERVEVAMAEDSTFERLQSGPDFLEQLAWVAHGLSLLTPRIVKSLRIWLANAARAERYFCDALDIARRQKAKLFELNRTATLARLLASQGKRDEARAMLAKTCCCSPRASTRPTSKRRGDSTTRAEGPNSQRGGPYSPTRTPHRS